MDTEYAQLEQALNEANREKAHYESVLTHLETERDRYHTALTVIEAIDASPGRVFAQIAAKALEVKS